MSKLAAKALSGIAGFVTKIRRDSRSSGSVAYDSRPQKPHLEEPRGRDFVPLETDYRIPLSLNEQIIPAQEAFEYMKAVILISGQAFRALWYPRLGRLEELFYCSLLEGANPLHFRTALEELLPLFKVSYRLGGEEDNMTHYEKLREAVTILDAIQNRTRILVHHFIELMELMRIHRDGKSIAYLRTHTLVELGAQNSLNSSERLLLRELFLSREDLLTHDCEENLAAYFELVEEFGSRCGLPSREVHELTDAVTVELQWSSLAEPR